jgi:hypothetical protein
MNIFLKKKEKETLEDNRKPTITRSLRKYALGLIIAIILYGILINIPKELKRKDIPIKHLLQKKENKNIAIPKIKGEIPSGDNIKYQWKGLRGSFVLVAKELTPIYEKPSLQSKVIDKLHISQRVSPKYQKPEKVVVDNLSSSWMFLVSYENKPLGWVLNNNLAYKNQFEPVSADWFFDNFSFRKGEYFATYLISEKGNFNNKWFASGGGIHLKSSYQGKIYRYKNLVWARRNSEDNFFDFFYLTNNDKIKPEWMFKDHPFIIEN